MMKPGYLEKCPGMKANSTKFNSSKNNGVIFSSYGYNLNFVVLRYQEKQWQTTGSFKQFNLEMRRIQGSKVTADNSLQFSIYSFAHTSVAWYEFGRWAPDHFDCVRQNTDSLLWDLPMVVAASSFEHVSLSSLTSLAMRITKLLVFAVTRTHPHL